MSCRPTILVVDDEPLIVSYLAETLIPIYQVRFAKDGRSALEMLKANVFDMIILDMFMPNMDGVEVLMHLFRMDAQIPVIAISGGSERTDFDPLESAKKLGAEVCLTKPFSSDDVLTSVSRILGFTASPLCVNN